jgi:hypothetical protein
LFSPKVAVWFSIEHVYRIDGHELERVKEIKDFGDYLDRKMTFLTHIETIISKSAKMLRFIKNFGTLTRWKHCMSRFYGRISNTPPVSGLLTRLATLKESSKFRITLLDLLCEECSGLQILCLRMSLGVLCWVFSLLRTGGGFLVHYWFVICYAVQLTPRFWLVNFVLNSASTPVDVTLNSCPSSIELTMASLNSAIMSFNHYCDCFGFREESRDVFCGRLGSALSYDRLGRHRSR